jgi:predicted RNA-binding Zn-ribbon protein involved in translation (DUF1610 family)
MSVIVYTYLCVNGACRHIELRSGVRYSQIVCPKCGHIMRLVKEEKQK